MINEQEQCGMPYRYKGTASGREKGIEVTPFYLIKNEPVMEYIGEFKNSLPCGQNGSLNIKIHKRRILFDIYYVDANEYYHYEELTRPKIDLYKFIIDESFGKSGFGTSTLIHYDYFHGTYKKKVYEKVNIFYSLNILKEMLCEYEDFDFHDVV